ncbi:MAG TPA: GNAT family N-acetyltransferase [Gemmataceae bacterium]|jgi:GNAT superfamily N-acetyltransferase|nr:GNAT family N-acetyltransferase [Gemmataceae bacterium]
MANWVIEALGKDHIRDAFDCGKPPLNEFLRSHAGQYERKEIGRTFVAVAAGSPVAVGYYTLAAGSVEPARLPVKHAKKLPRHPIGVVLLGRLAVDRSAQGKHLGGDLLIDASIRCVRTANQVGVFALTTSAIDDEAARFYGRFGFLPFVDNPHHLFLPVETLRKLHGSGA